MVRAAFSRSRREDEAAPGGAVTESLDAPTGGAAVADLVGERTGETVELGVRGVADDATGVANGQATSSAADQAAATTSKNKKPEAERRADFSRLASRRLSRALDALDSFANLANRQSYMWDLDQESKIFVALHERVEGLAKAFAEARGVTTGKKPAKPLSFTV